MSIRSKIDHPVRQVRNALNPEFKITQQVLANMIGCTRETISRVESGKVELSEDLAMRIDAAMGSKLTDWLKEGEALDQFEIDTKHLGANFQRIRDFEAQQLWHADVSANPLLLKQLSSILGKPLSIEEVEKVEAVASDEFFKALDLVRGKLDFIDADFEKKARLARALLAGQRLESVFTKELDALAEIFVSAFDSHKFPAIQWSFVQWLAKTVKEFELETDVTSSSVVGGSSSLFGGTIEEITTYRYQDGFGTHVDWSEDSKDLIDGKLISGRFSEDEWAFVVRRQKENDLKELTDT